MTLAVVDVGSNSVLLTVCRRNQEGGWDEVLETSRVTGLGRGVAQTGELSGDGMTDTLAALSQAFTDARRAGADRTVAAATMAARMASNVAEFQARAEAQATPVEILSGEREAELGFRAVADDPLFSECTRLSIIDPGGQSTELVTAERATAGWDLRFRRSFLIGTLQLRGSLLSEEAPDGPTRMAALRQLDQTIGLEYLPHAAGTAVVLGATGTNLITIREQMTTWDSERVHGAILDYEEVGRAVGWLCGMTDRERAAIVGMEPGREGTIHIGSLILERFMYALHVLEIRVSVRGWRHALLAEIALS
ncbi:MAG TPA: hypothetical protein PLH94_14330 [Fimbriimonadaceae bacterium]|nr:hypothetical protein [Fimbriimonadaceae bacterium]